MANLDAVYDQIQQRLAEDERRLREDARIRIWDGDWDFVAEIQGTYSHEFDVLRNDSGTAVIELPVEHAVAQLLLVPEEWPTKSMYVTFDKDGVRWSGRIAGTNVKTNARGENHLRISVLHDYQKLKELLVWANPFLPAEVQFPKAWFLFGPSRWAVTTTLFVNLLRKNVSLWMIPDDPVDVGQWFDLDMSNWNMAVKPVDFFSDSSLPAVVSSRFKYFHDCVKDILDDAQLVIECRRYLPGDPPPWPGANLRYGCLVFDVVDKSGWNRQTSNGGSIFDGLVRVINRVLSDGMTEGVEVVPRVEFPSEYYEQGFMGSLPEAPWVVLEHGPHTGMESSDYEYIPPGPAQFVIGGSSMPFVNEGIKAGIIGLGGLLGSIIGQSQIGSVAAEVLEPLYSDVFLAFMAHKHHDRISDQGWDYPYEHWIDSGDKAYTVAALSALRRAKHDTRERHSVTIEMQNGAPYWVGDQGHGDFYIGDRVAVHALGMPKDKLFVEQVERLAYSSNEEGMGWEVEVGMPELTTGIDYLARRYEQLTSGLRDLGVW